MRARKFRPALAGILLLLPCLVPAGAATDAVEPGRIEGLEAWYRADAPELKTGDPVSVWPDGSGRGHDLVDDRNGLHAVCEAMQINDLPAVRIGKSNSHAVTEPFELGDHTVFVVFRADLTGRALFGNEADEFAGLVLRAEGLHDRLTVRRGPGGALRLHGTRRPAARPHRPGTGGGSLHEFVDGVDRSLRSRVRGHDPRRASFFQSLAHPLRQEPTARVCASPRCCSTSGFSVEAERQQVTRYLAEKYAMAVQGTEAAPEDASAGPAPAPVAGGRRWPSSAPRPGSTSTRRWSRCPGTARTSWTRRSSTTPENNRPAGLHARTRPVSGSTSRCR